jgi:hypothetical protein
MQGNLPEHHHLRGSHQPLSQVQVQRGAEFLERAPEQFKEGIEDPHKRMLQRLGHEKHERLEARKKVQALETRRDALKATVDNKRNNLGTLEVRVCLCLRQHSALHPAGSCCMAQQHRLPLLLGEAGLNSRYLAD